jgi:hypothetical protein
VRLSRFGRITGGYVLFTVVGCIVLAVLSVWLECGAKPVAWFCASDGMLNTIAQVIPATVVAIFVFALGATFVIAQIVVPSRGSRSIGELFSYRRVRWVLVGGLVLLGGSLLITLGPDGTDTSGPAGTDTSPPWSLELATVLVAATILYIGVATCLIVWTFLDQLSPRLFKERLTNPPRINPLGSRGWTSEELYRVLRVLRGWLRTVNRVGESRDLQFGLEGVHELVTAYAGEVWKEGSDGTRRSRLYDPPKSYEQARKAARTQIPLPPCGGEQPRQQGSGSSSAGNGSPWFADELGRALTRAVESGVRGNTLRRDLDRLLNLFEVGIREFAPCDTGRPVLADEVRTLIKHLTEVALGVRQCEDWQRDWFVAPALRLARIERHLEHVADHTAVCAAGRPDPDFSLARTALVGWLLAGDALICVEPEPQRSSLQASFLEQSIPLLGEDRRIWDKPLACEEWYVLEPEWDVQVESCTARHTRLQKRFAKARRQKAGRAGGPRPTTAG